MSIAREPSRRRRAPESARSEALTAARKILMDEGPAAITLKAVASAVGVTHANLLYHFGSAAGLQRALMDAMVLDLCDALEATVAAVIDGQSEFGKPLDTVFEAFSKGGAARLMAWLTLSGEAQHLEPIQQRLAGLVNALAAPLPRDDRQRLAKVRRTVLLSAYLAFADALIGPVLLDMLKMPADTARNLGREHIFNILREGLA